MAEAAPAPAHTSIDVYRPTEVTVMFRRWTAFNNTAYMRGQTAGFSRHEAAALRARGLVDIVEAQAAVGAAPARVTK